MKTLYKAIGRKMNESIEYDETWGQRLIQIYSTPDVVKQREIILSKLNLQPGERVIDIGSGPGLLAEDIAKEVGSSGLICGVDISDAMIALSSANSPGPEPMSITLSPGCKFSLDIIISLCFTTSGVE